MLKLSRLALLLSLPLIVACQASSENVVYNGAYQASVCTTEPVQSGQNNTFLLGLQHADGTPVLPEELEVVHTERVHVLMIDPSLSDYRHEHPPHTSTPGIYEFTTHLDKAGEYRVFVDIKDVANQQQTYVKTTVMVPGQAQTVQWAAISPGEMETDVQVNDLSFDIYVEADAIIVDQDYMLNIMITDAHGELFRQLEPIMGTYAHLVGFNAQGDDILHTHPMGTPPTSSNQRGGPNVRFHLHFDKPGMHRLFAQFQINGENVFVPFDVYVAQQS